MAEVQAVRAAMEKDGKTPVSFPIVDKYLRPTVASLPSAIRIEPRRITVEVDEGTPDQMCEVACQLLFELSMALNNDHDRFRDHLAAIEDAPAPASMRSTSNPIQQGWHHAWLRGCVHANLHATAHERGIECVTAFPQARTLYWEHA